MFNVEQIENLPAHYYAAAQAPQIAAADRIAHVDQFLENLGAAVRHGGNRAFYTIGADTIQMPHFQFFKDPESYYATRLHETAQTQGKGRSDGMSAAEKMAEERKRQQNRGNGPGFSL